jgi:hypothetical protein
MELGSFSKAMGDNSNTNRNMSAFSKYLSQVGEMDEKEEVSDGNSQKEIELDPEDSKTRKRAKKMEKKISLGLAHVSPEERSSFSQLVRQTYRKYKDEK